MSKGYNPEPYQWNRFFLRKYTGNDDGGMQGGICYENGIAFTLFDKFKPINEAYTEFLTKPGVIKALDGKHTDKKFVSEVENTVKWAESDFKDPIHMVMYPRWPDYDFYKCFSFRVVVSPRVLEYFKKHKQGQFEAFPVKIVEELPSPIEVFVINILTKSFKFDFGHMNFKGLK